MGRLQLGGAEEFLAANSLRRARLIKITPQFPEVAQPVYLTTAANAITFEGNTYQVAAAIDLSAQSEKTGSPSYDTEIQGAIDSDILTNDDLNNGVYRGAEVVEYIVDSRFPFAGYLRTYRYFIQDIMWDGEAFQASCEGIQASTPDAFGETFSRQCVVPLFSDHCTLNKLDYQYPVGGNPTTVSALGDDKRRFTSAGLQLPGNLDGDYFDYGFIEWASGFNIGGKSTVLNYDDSTRTFLIAEPTQFNINIGDGFFLYPGCNKTVDSCRFKFNQSNIRNFQGAPFVRTASGAIDAPSGSSSEED